MTQPLVDRSCCFSFDDLFEAVHGRGMTDGERRALFAMTQPSRNDWVKQMALRTGERFMCEDRRGSDGVVYTAFWAIEG